MTDESSKQPPSFQPKAKGRRPSAHGARRVGTGMQPSGLTRSESGVPSKPPVRQGPPAPIRRSAFQNSGLGQTSQASNNISHHRGDWNSQELPPSYQPARSDESLRSESAPTPRVYPPKTHQNSPHSPEGKHSGSNTPLIPTGGDQNSTQPPRSKKITAKKIFAGIITVVLIVVIAIAGWGYHLYTYGNNKLQHLDALSDKADTPGETYLLVGSDKRGGSIQDDTEGQRSDTVMLFHVPEQGTPSLISLPRDAYVAIPGHDKNKLNAAYSLGGPKLLVATVEELSGMKVDHYIEVGMDGIKNLTDAVGRIELCYDSNVDDRWSGLQWTAGCHHADGTVALAFSRMRKADPLGDIGRTARQRQVVQALLSKAISQDVIWSPSKQKALVGAAADSLTVDQKDNLWDIGMAGLDLKKVIGKSGLIGVPPIKSLNYHPGHVGSAVRLDEAKLPEFWQHVQSGTITQEELTPHPAS